MIPLLLTLFFGRRAKPSRADDTLLRQMLSQQPAPPPAPPQPYYSGMPYYGYPPPAPARRGGWGTALVNILSVGVLLLVGYLALGQAGISVPALPAQLGELVSPPARIDVRAPAPPVVSVPAPPRPQAAPQAQPAPVIAPQPAVIEQPPGAVEQVQTWVQPATMPTAEILPQPPQPAAVVVVEMPQVYQTESGSLYTPVPAPPTPAPFVAPPDPALPSDARLVYIEADGMRQQCLVVAERRVCAVDGIRPGTYGFAPLMRSGAMGDAHSVADEVQP